MPALKFRQLFSLICFVLVSSISYAQSQSELKKQQEWIVDNAASFKGKTLSHFFGSLTYKPKSVISGALLIPGLYFFYTDSNKFSDSVYYLRVVLEEKNETKPINKSAEEHTLSESEYAVYADRIIKKIEAGPKNRLLPRDLLAKKDK